MKPKVYAPEEEQAICEAYRNRNNNVTDIIEKYGLADHRHLRKILDKYDVPPRKEYAPRKHRKDEQMEQRKCPKCGKAIDNPNARFCWYCGADVRTPKMAAIEALDRCVLGNLELVTPAVRDEMSAAVRNAIALLKEE